jgi:lycopene cyclase domain-containing protein
MTPPLTYAGFLAAFVLLPIGVLLALGSGIDATRRRAATGGIALMVCIATAYTVPWDNYLLAVGVWEYGDGVLLGRIGFAPVEEYAFIALQPVLTALWLYRRPLPEATPGVRFPTARGETVGVGSLVAGGGIVALFGGSDTFYLVAILAWAAPPLVLQWFVGGRYLWAVRQRLLVAVVPPTLYLASVDRLAIAWGIWELSPRFTTGIGVVGLPLEEGAFFLVTNLLVVQGLLLYHQVLETWE